jgi:hypothetical protein
VDGGSHGRGPVIGRWAGALEARVRRRTLAVVPDPKTEELRLEQIQRERKEREQADDSADPDEAKAHSRRAERAAYLREKLGERARSEDEDG